MVKIKSIKSLWGMEGSLESQFERIAVAGYHGIESPVPSQLAITSGVNVDEKRFRSLLEQYKLDYVSMVFTENDDHAESFRRQIEHAAEFNPILINSHSAKDAMPFDEQAIFFEKALAIEQKLGIPVGHETHRGRAMFTPWTTAALLSHWVCVCESLLEDQKEYMKMSFQRSIHIHTRVGYAQGPQVPHPAAPEYMLELSAHEDWWKQIIQARSNSEMPLTFTPEFGPPGYMPRLPFTGQPVADLWQVCLWMKERFERLIAL
jgi:hypothetical protein